MTDIKLHRFHMFQQATRLQFDHKTFGMAWRADGRYSLELKQAIAHRLAVCWNVLEGMPTELLLQGFLGELCTAVAEGDIERAKAALAKMDRGTDMTEGRLHDCAACHSRGEDDDTVVAEVEAG